MILCEQKILAYAHCELLIMISRPTHFQIRILDNDMHFG